MSKLYVRAVSMSVDGYTAGPAQSLDNPLGVRGRELHEWVFATRGGRAMIGEQGGTEGIDNDYFDAGFRNIGASIMGRNMFGPIRGDWGDESWRGWWGDNPPYHHPVFVLTHHPRQPLEMEGGTTFFFTDDDIATVFDRAKDAAQGKDVRLNGGAATIRQYLNAGLIDEMHVPIVPVLLGSGERIFENGLTDSYEVTKFEQSPAVTHVTIARKN
jgi:dihydrofolate reductase